MKLVRDSYARFDLFAGGLLILALASCAQDREGSAGKPGSTGGATGSMGGGSAAVGTGGINAGGGGSTVGAGGVGGDAAAGAAGGGGVNAPLVNISGRWGMFTFEDPVGVQLFQAPDGTLTGRGCAAFAPGGPPAQIPSEDQCGDITGKVSGRSASFGFPVQALPGRYAVQVTVSDDAQRMAGVFNNRIKPGEGKGDLRIAWLRVADSAEWLAGDNDQPSPERAPVGRYNLTLLTALSTGTEYASGQTYALVYSPSGVSGDLGSFWISEMSRLAMGSPQRVGPVRATIASFPNELEFDLVPMGPIGRVTAKTSSGGIYVFTADWLN